ncbi:type II toxin-antitoxin system HigB family toxin [Dyadobacter arcticus]|uniref:mRNA interferase HigB n=1 Tax=Dyadobacter arcticus TaxID=1078754 RepID=A0ABX0UEQ2_9BACT|nr:type II toxin-antitoxin system HigB family toxin [Dyadobacter arcticus]NIJ51466.1 mRNA interferase HigB [Dyadobacter arcticus]
MVIISKTVLSAFSKIHPNAAKPLNQWYRIVKRCNWSCFNSMRDTFNAVDAVGNDRYVFNIKGNNYRIVAMIHFDKRTVYIRFIGTHGDYDRIICSIV